jgi:hypothetical protein
LRITRRPFTSTPDRLRTPQAEGSRVAKREFDGSIAGFTEAIRLNPKQETPWHWRGHAYFSKKDYDRAFKDCFEAIRLEPKFAPAYHGFAWLLATSSIDGLREGKRAIALATKACELSGWKDDNSLLALAAAYAENGDFKEAVRWQEKAIELGFDSKARGEWARSLLERYQQGKPYRADPAPTPEKLNGKEVRRGTSAGPLGTRMVWWGLDAREGSVHGKSGIGHPRAVVRGRATGRPASTAARASRRSL